MATTHTHKPAGKGARKPAAAKAVRERATRAQVSARLQPPALPVDGESHAAFDPDLRHRMISEAAYYLYSQRGYAEGYDFDDWLTAEAQIDDLLMNREREDELEASAPLAAP
jgi:hypothetical protein